MIDNVTDERRAQKLKQMRVRQHNKRCQDKGTCVDLGCREPKMNGRYICGDTKQHFEAGKNNMRQLIEQQFKLDIAK